MNHSDVLALYDDTYAAAYDDRFLLAPLARLWTESELSLLRGLLAEGSRWLDVACGTGYFLSRFPGVPRAGLDLSPAMVARASQANPDALFIRRGSYLDPIEEWNGQWSVVSCMWAAYSYVQSMDEIERLLDNLVRWTAVGGSLLLPVVDHEDVREGQQIPYEEPVAAWGGTVAVTGITWTWTEPGTGKVHTHLVAPHLDHFVRLLQHRFRRIDVVRYLPSESGGTVRRAVVARGKRSTDDSGLAEVVRHPLPGPQRVPDPPGPSARDLSSAELAAELGRRLAPWKPDLWRGLRRRVFRWA